MVPGESVSRQAMTGMPVDHGRPQPEAARPPEARRLGRVYEMVVGVWGVGALALLAVGFLAGAKTGGAPMVVERVRLVGKDIAIEGSFELPELARLAAEDQVFVAAFVRSHGSIKEMEQVFGVSYPTARQRYADVLGRLGLEELEIHQMGSTRIAVALNSAVPDFGSVASIVRMFEM